MIFEEFVYYCDETNQIAVTSYMRPAGIHHYRFNVRRKPFDFIYVGEL